MYLVIELNNKITFEGITLRIISKATTHILLEDGWLIDLVNNLIIESSGYEHPIKLERRDHVQNWINR